MSVSAVPKCFACHLGEEAAPAEVQACAWQQAQGEQAWEEATSGERLCQWLMRLAIDWRVDK